MQRVLIFVLLGLLPAGCASLGVRTEGTSGPIAWHVTDLKSELVPFQGTIGDARGTYSLTLVLTETQGIPITFTYRKDTIYAADLTVLRAADQAIHLRLRPHEERRFPLTFSWGCAAADCLAVENVAPRWTITLTGTDGKGNAVQAVITMHLPPNPATYKPPSSAGKTEGESPKTLGSIEAPVPVWKPGYEWQYRWESPQGKGTFVWTVNREEIVDGVAYYVLTAGREREMYWRRADLAHYLEKVRGEVERRNVPPRLRYMWPLALGKTWEETFTQERPRDHQTNEFALQCQVEAEETITVPAGTFRAFKIVCRHRRTGSIGSETWYAPEVKQWIRERGRFDYGIRERELTGFKVE